MNAYRHVFSSSEDESTPRISNVFKQVKKSSLSKKSFSPVTVSSTSNSPKHFSPVESNNNDITFAERSKTPVFNDDALVADSEDSIQIIEDTPPSKKPQNDIVIDSSPIVPMVSKSSPKRSVKKCPSRVITFSDDSDDDLLCPLSERLGLDKKTLIPKSKPVKEVDDIRIDDSGDDTLTEDNPAGPSHQSKYIPDEFDDFDDAFLANIDDQTLTSKIVTPLKSDPKTISKRRSKEVAYSPLTRASPAVVKKTKKTTGHVVNRNEVRKQKELEAQQAKVQREVNSQRTLKNCLKNCRAFMDSGLIGSLVRKEELDAKVLEYEVKAELMEEKAAFPSLIKWKRKNSTFDTDGFNVNYEDKDEDMVMVVVQSDDFVRMVHAYKSGNVTSSETDSSQTSADDEQVDFIQFVKSIAKVCPDKHIILIRYGLAGYFRKLKSKENRAFTAAMTGKTQRKRNSVALPLISRMDIEEALIDLDLRGTVEIPRLKSVRVVNAENPGDIALSIATFTRAIAEKPIKMGRNEEHMSFAWYAAGDNRCTVDVKGPADVTKLWRRQLEQFPKVSRDVSEAIAKKYPNINSLMAAYNQFSDPSDGKLLLENILIGKSGTRRLGPELSRKIFVYFTTHDPSVFLG